MHRKDDGLAFMVQYENVAWYEDGVVKILDRRIYPKELSYVVCSDYREVAQAIADMVTQSGGPRPFASSVRWAISAGWTSRSPSR